MQKLVWQNANGVELDLTSGNYGITEWEGFSNASLNIQSQQVPFQDGGVFLDALIEQRELSVTLAMQDNNNLELRYQQRRELISALNPKLGEGYLIYTNDFISKRIKCVPQIPLFETHNSDTVGTPKASLSWTACSPYWENIEETVVPEIALYEERSIVNEGDVETPVEIEVNLNTDVVQNIKIMNRTTKQEIELLGETTESFVINTEVGKKTIRTRTVEQEEINEVITGQICVNNVLYGRSGNKIKKSEDGLTWETVFSSSLESITKLKYVNGYIFALGNKGSRHACIYSTDGKQWTRKDLYDSASGWNINDIAYSSNLNKYILVGSNRIFTTTDLITFNATLMSLYYIGVEIKGSTICVYGATSVNKSFVQTSTDMTNWTTRTTSVTGDNTNFIDSVVWEDNFYLLANDGTVLISSDGASWSTDTTVTSDYTKIDKTENNTRIVLYGNSSTIYYKTSGWIPATTGATITQFSSMCFFNGSNILYKNNYSFVTTNNFSDFVEHSLQYTQMTGMRRIVTNKEGTLGLILALVNSTTYYFYKTADFVHFEEIEIDDKTGLYHIKFVNGKFYIFGARVLESEDLEQWTELQAPETSISDLTYSEDLGKWIYIYSIYSTNIYMGDFINGFELVYTYNNDIQSVEWIPSLHKVLTAGGYGYTLQSTDGINWTEQRVGTASIGKIYVCGEYIYLIGNYYDFIKYSKDLLNWKNSTGISYPIAIAGDGKGNVLIASGGNYNWFGLSYNNGISFRPVVKGDGVSTDRDIIYLKNGNKFVKITNEGSMLYGVKLIESGNLINKLSPNSDMGFKLTQGKNEISIVVLTGDVSANISYRQKYIGV